MMKIRSRLSEIKSKQRASVVYRTVAPLVCALSQEHEEVAHVYITRTEFSPGGTLCYLYLYTEQGEAVYEKALKKLTLYIPSLRKSVARALNGRYAPEILFAFDVHHEKVIALERLIDRVSSEPGEHRDTGLPVAGE